MNFEQSQIENIYLEESDFTDFEFFIPTSKLFILSLLILFIVIPFSILFISIDTNYKVLEGFFAPISLIIYFVIITNDKIHKYIFEKRIRHSLDYFNKLTISYDEKWKNFTFDPEENTSIMDMMGGLILVFCADLVALLFIAAGFDYIFPNPNLFQNLTFLLLITLSSYSLMTFAMLKGIWVWYRSPNYYAESFYFLKSFLLNKDQPAFFEMVLDSFDSFSRFTGLNGSKIVINEEKILYLVNTLRFFKPDEEIIGDELIKLLSNVLIQLKEKKWLEVIKSIEILELNLKQAQDKLESVSVTSGYSAVMSESSTVEIDNIKSNDSKNYIIDNPTFRKKFSDSFLVFMLFCEGKRGESPLIEYKRALNPNKYEDISSIIASIANTDSGILFFGWNEEQHNFMDIDAEKTEQSIKQLIEKQITPRLDYLIHKLNHSLSNGLLVVIPRSSKLHSVNDKTPIRRGSHREYLDAEAIIKKNEELKNLPKGYLSLDTLEYQYKKQFESKNNDFSSFIHLFTLFHEIKKVKERIIHLSSTWDLDFKIWYLPESLNQRYRIPLIQWKPKKPPGELTTIISKLTNIDQALSSSTLNEFQNKDVYLLLKDNTFREETKIHHRRCLWSYLNQQNPWNFTDWRYFIESTDSMEIRLYYEEGRQKYVGQPHQETIKIYSKDRPPTTSEIEEEIKRRVIDKYQRSAKNLISKIMHLLESILKGLEDNFCCE